VGKARLLTASSEEYPRFVSELPSGTVTFLFTDVEGSTRLLQQLGERYAEVSATQQRIVRGAVQAAHGREIDTQGDGSFFAFHRAKDAVAAAVAAQRALAASEWPDGAEVRVRMGVHTGEPAVGADRYVGIGVHRAARICAAGHGGQILVSQTTCELLLDDPLPDTRFRDLGEHRLKDLERPERVYQVVASGLPHEFAPLNAVVARPVAAGWDFRILGPLEVLHDGEALALGGRRPRSVLALLLLHAGEVVSTDLLIDELWGEEPPRTAMTSLQNTISQLRKVLGADRLLTRPPGYVLRIEDDELDLRRFERLVADAGGAEPEERAQKLRRGLSLWRGAPLADFSFDSFAQGEINRFEELRLTVLEDRIDADLELGRHADLVGELEALVQKHPLRERLRGQLMLALYRSGRQAEALQCYQAGRRALVDELGIDPSPALQELHGSILRQERRLDSPGGTPAGSDHYDEVVNALERGRLVVALGANVNMSGRPEHAQVGSNGDSSFVPAAPEIVAHLAKLFDCPPEHARELAHVAQYVALLRGLGPLYDELHALFNRDFPPGPVQCGLAHTARALREQGLPGMLIVTTNFDHTLERAFADIGEEFDVVAYVAAGRNRGKFLHVAPDGRARIVDIPNTYADVTPERRTVILKIHGQVDRGPDREWDSFVISEDDYIGYLAQTDLANVVPVSLAAKLRRSHFLFVGYVLEEWSLRVFLQRVWGDDQVAYRSWAVQPSPGRIDAELWRRRGIQVFDEPLDAYVTELAARVGAVIEAA
jgi:DNA-binding SARP family transcriptional activator/class 3 adenylate cyclase